MRFATVLALVVVSLLPLAAVNGEQYATGSNVVHTRRLPVPVVAHRVVPPFRGMHVYSGRRR